MLDLTNSVAVDEIICADANLESWDSFAATMDTKKITPVKIDASSKESLVELFEQNVDAAIDLLPIKFMLNAFEAAIAVEIPVEEFIAELSDRGIKIDFEEQVLN